MALSGSTDFVLDRDALILAAWRKIGIYNSFEGEAPTGTERSDASITLNLMLKSWIADGLQLWLIKEVTHTLVANTQSYTVGLAGDIAIVRPEKLINIYYQDNQSFERHLEEVSRQEYFSLSDKASKGAPTLWYYDPQLTLGKLYVWPVLNTIDATTPEKIRIKYQKYFDDLDSSVDDIEVPQYCLQAVVWGLAAELAFEYGIENNRLMLIQQKAQIEKQRMLDYDQELTSVYLQPESEYYRGF